jgi:hypothetical protein
MTRSPKSGESDYKSVGEHGEVLIIRKPLRARHGLERKSDLRRPGKYGLRDRDLCHYFRADAAFANPEVYEFLEGEDFKYVIRLPTVTKIVTHAR